MSAQQHILFQWGSYGSEYNGSSSYKGEHNYCHHHCHHHHYHQVRRVWCFPGNKKAALMLNVRTRNCLNQDLTAVPLEHSGDFVLSLVS